MLFAELSLNILGVLKCLKSSLKSLAEVVCASFGAFAWISATDDQFYVQEYSLV